MTPGIILTRDKAALEAALGLDANSARIEVQCLLQAVLQVNRAWLLTHPEETLNIEQQTHYATVFERRIRGEPLSYILGRREFYGLNFKVTPATLIPRHDTELLVELALQRIPSLPLPIPLPDGNPHPIPLPDGNPHPIPPPEGNPHPIPPPKGEGSFALSPFGGKMDRGLGTNESLRDFHDNEKKRKFRVLDMGTGSGAIALSIAHARPDAEVVAVDASMDALEIARENAYRLNTGNLRLLHSDWFSALQGERFDLIVSNPPYIACDDAHLAQGDLRFEPRTALVSGRDGLDDIRRITAQAQAYLNAQGWLLFEHGYNQAAEARDLLGYAGFVEVFSSCDLSGIERVSGGRSGR